MFEGLIKQAVIKYDESKEITWYDDVFDVEYLIGYNFLDDDIFITTIEYSDENGNWILASEEEFDKNTLNDTLVRMNQYLSHNV